MGGLVVVAAAMPLGACALLVGDPDGHKLFPEGGAESEEPDSTAPADGSSGGSSNDAMDRGCPTRRNSSTRATPARCLESFG